MPPPNRDILLLQIQYPGMPRPESDVCKLWLERHMDEYDRIEFHVRLGDGVDPGPDVAEPYRGQAVKLTQKKADMIAWAGGHATIAEVKLRAGLGALGQLQGYKLLYERAHPDEPPPRLLVIARLADGDVRSVLAESGIDLVLYEART